MSSILFIYFLTFHAYRLLFLAIRPYWAEIKDITVKRVYVYTLFSFFRMTMAFSLSFSSNPRSCLTSTYSLKLWSNFWNLTFPGATSSERISEKAHRKWWRKVFKSSPFLKRIMRLDSPKVTRASSLLSFPLLNFLWGKKSLFEKFGKIIVSSVRLSRTPVLFR